MISEYLEKSEEYVNLSDKQRLNFMRRLNLCSEIIANVRLYADGVDTSTTGVFDDIELDAYSVMSVGSPEEYVSPYLVHSSWTMYCDPLRMQLAISPELKYFQSLIIPGCDAKIEQVVDWYRKWGAVALETMVQLEHAPSFDAAVACCLCIDALIASLLVSSAILRINPNVATRYTEA